MEAKQYDTAVLLVGLTGGIGAGKSTVAELLAARGAVVLDADAVAREVVVPGSPALAAIVERFGLDVLAGDGSLDRARLAREVFASPEARGALETITHPAIHAEFARRMAAAPPDSVVVLDIPLLVEKQADSARSYDAVVVVEAPEDLRLDRLADRGVDRDDARARIRAQATDEQRRAVATHVVPNGVDRSALEDEVDRLWAELVARADASSMGSMTPGESGPASL